MTVIKAHLTRPNLYRAALLVLALGLLPQASFAHSAACGNATVLDDAIVLDTAWDTLVSCALDLSDGQHTCVITASADFDNPGGPNSQNRYRLATAVDAVAFAVDGPFERTAVLTNNAGIKNPDSTSVSTVEAITLSAGNHTFRSFARKWQAATSNGVVSDSSLGVVCVDANANANPEEGLNEEATEASSDGSTANRR